MTTAPKATRGVFGKKPDKLDLPDVLGNLTQAVPSYGDLTELLSSNILNNLRGVISPDVNQVVRDAANARAVAGGFGGSGLGQNLTLRDLGLTSMGLQNQGIGQALQYLPVQSRTATLDPSIQTGINLFNKTVESKPDPVKEAQFYLDQQFNAMNPVTQGMIGGVGRPLLGGVKPISGGGVPSFSSVSSPTMGFNPFSSFSYNAPSPSQIQNTPSTFSAYGAGTPNTPTPWKPPQWSVPQSASSQILYDAGINADDYGIGSLIPNLA